MSREFRFYREYPSGKWYIDLPEWEGSKDDLEMVMGADSFLALLSEGSDEVRISLSDEYREGYYKMVLRELGKFEGVDIGSGAWYFMEDYMGQRFEYDMWLCDVTLFVFECFPETIWFSPVRM